METVADHCVRVKLFVPRFQQSVLHFHCHCVQAPLVNFLYMSLSKTSTEASFNDVCQAVKFMLNVLTESCIICLTECFEALQRNVVISVTQIVLQLVRCIYRDVVRTYFLVSWVSQMQSFMRPCHIGVRSVPTTFCVRPCLPHRSQVAAVSDVCALYYAEGVWLLFTLEFRCGAVDRHVYRYRDGNGS